MDENQPSYYSQLVARAIAIVFCVDNARRVRVMSRLKILTRHALVRVLLTLNMYCNLQTYCPATMQINPSK